MTVRKNNQGFTIMEVLVTMFILAVVLIMLIGFFVYGYNVFSRTRQVAFAAQIAKQQVELIRNMAFEDILALPSSSNFNHPHLDHPVLENGTGSYTIEDIPEDNQDLIKKLTVTITWDYGGRQMKKSVVTYITKEGINRR
ncbi:MAG: prepilin-type N-terminal cleavage/methylation domain-containing protein [Candidatus Aminicenantes bacterium]